MAYIPNDLLRQAQLSAQQSFLGEPAPPNDPRMLGAPASMQLMDPAVANQIENSRNNLTRLKEQELASRIGNMRMQAIDNSMINNANMSLAAGQDSRNAMAALQNYEQSEQRFPLDMERLGLINEGLGISNERASEELTNLRMQFPKQMELLESQIEGRNIQNEGWDIQNDFQKERLHQLEKTFPEQLAALRLQNEGVRTSNDTQKEMLRQSKESFKYNLGLLGGQVTQQNLDNDRRREENRQLGLSWPYRRDLLGGQVTQQNLANQRFGDELRFYNESFPYNLGLLGGQLTQQNLANDNQREMNRQFGLSWPYRRDLLGEQVRGARVVNTAQELANTKTQIDNDEYASAPFAWNRWMNNLYTTRSNRFSPLLSREQVRGAELQNDIAEAKLSAMVNAPKDMASWNKLSPRDQDTAIKTAVEIINQIVPSDTPPATIPGTTEGWTDSIGGPEKYRDDLRKLVAYLLVRNPNPIVVVNQAMDLLNNNRGKEVDAIIVDLNFKPTAGSMLERMEEFDKEHGAY